MTREYGDDLLDRIADEEEEDAAAEKLGMTLSEFRDYCQAQRDEAAISRMESDQ